jgi:hypothetical protein
MMTHSNRALVHARNTFAPADISPLLDATQFISDPYDFALKPKRVFRSTLRDLFLIVIGWMFFVGVIVYPIAFLVGLAACAIALLALPTEKGAVVILRTRVD